MAPGLPSGYASYDALIQDPDIDAVYIPLPHHMHVEWTIKALQCGQTCVGGKTHCDAWR